MPSAAVRRRAAVKGKKQPLQMRRNPSPKQRKERTPRHHLVAFAAAVCIIAAALVVYLGVQQPPPSAINHTDAVDGFASDYGITPWMRRRGEIPRMRWVDVVALATREEGAQEVSGVLAARREPLIVTGSPADAWPAMTKWPSEAYLAHKLGMLHKVKRGRDSLFIYTNSDGSLLAPEKRRSLHIPEHIGIVAPDTTERVNVTIAQFFECNDKHCSSGGNASAAAQRQRPLYYSRVLNTAEDFGKVVDDVSATRDAFVVWDDWRDCFPGCQDQDNAAGKGAEHHAWVGHPGVITGGKKRFVIAPPDAWPKMRLYSTWHPRTRQSQQDAYTLDQKVFADSRARESDRVFAQEPTSREQVVDVMVADLSRGDVLYLPPMYFHRVATMPEDFAMAVNVWSSSKEEILIDALAAQELPEDLTKITPGSAPLRPGVLAVLVKELIRGVLSLQNEIEAGIDFVSTLKDELELRKKSLGVNMEDIIGGSSDDVEEQQVAAFIALLIQQRYLFRGEFGESIGCGEWKPERCPSEHRLGDDTVARVQRFVNERVLPPFRSYFNQIARASDGQPQRATGGVVTLVLTDYLEKIVSFTVSLPKSCLYLRCLAQVHAWGPAPWL